MCHQRCGIDDACGVSNGGGCARVSRGGYPAVFVSNHRGACGTACVDEVPVRVWICDVNGVLVDSAAVVREAYAATASRFGLSWREYALRRVQGLSLLEAYRILDPGCEPFVRAAFHQQYVQERVAELRACAGVRDTLAAARRAGVRIGAATSYGKFAEAALVSTGLYPFIDVLVTQTEVLRPKPHPDAIQRALALLGGDVRQPSVEAVHVGDTAEDVRAGHAAGVRTVGVTYGMSRESEIRAAEPDYIIHAFDEMRWWLAGAASQDVDLVAVESLRPGLEG